MSAIEQTYEKKAVCRRWALSATISKERRQLQHLDSQSIGSRVHGRQFQATPLPSPQDLHHGCAELHGQDESHTRV